MASSSDEKKVHYPTLYFPSPTELDIPEEGEAVISFRRVEQAENTRNPDDPKYRYELEVKSIEVKDGERINVGERIKGALRKRLEVEVEE